MKAQKPVNISLLVLVMLFVLAQTAFAITVTVSDTLGGTPIVDGEVLINTYITSCEPIIDGEALESPITQTINQNNSQQSVLQSQQQQIAPAQQLESSLSQQLAVETKKEIKSVVKYVNANSLNVREEPNSESKLITTISRGDKVTFYETQGEWARIITWTDKKGYILSKYLVNSEKDVEKVEKKEVSSVSRSSSQSSKPLSAEGQSTAEKIVSYAKSLQGVKYVYGGYSTSGLDCSGLTKYVFAKFGINIPRSSSEYYGVGTKVSRSDLKQGDILLFDAWDNKVLSHVGIYIGDGNFIHASTSKGKVVIQNLNTYNGNYLGARRVLN